MPKLPLAVKGGARILHVCDFGHSLLPYGVALRIQSQLADSIKANELPDTLLQLQHSAVYTLGKRGRLEDFHTPVEVLRRRGVEVYEIGRGGETTFHGPGQVILYPIVSLRRLGRGARAYVEGLEDTIIGALLQFGISAQLLARIEPDRKLQFLELQGRVPGRTGVWIGDRKIAAIGVQISSGIARHGLAVNVVTDLSAFDHIVPCGIADKEVTSVEREMRVGQGRNLVDEVSVALRESFVQEFGYQRTVEVGA